MTDTVRIAYLTGEYPAVSHTFILREIEALRGHGLEVITASIRRTGPEHHRGPAEKAAAASTFYVLDAARRPGPLARALLMALRRPGVFSRVLRLAWQARRPGLRGALYQLFYLAEALILAGHLRRAGATHLHNHFAQASATVAMLAAELAGLPFSFTLHGPADFLDPVGWRLDEKIRRARFVACISHFCRSQAMIHARPADWPKLAIVHCGVEPDRYRRDPAPATGPVPARELLFVGRLAAVKGVPLLLEAMARLRAEHPGARLTLIGDGPERARIEAEAARLGLGDRVVFAGYRSQDEVAGALARSDLFVLPSFAEGVPVVLMEAMAAGLPVIATRIAGIPELVEDGVSGRVVDPGSAAALTAAIGAVLADPGGAARMGAAGRDRVRAGFDVRAEALRLATLFRDGPAAEDDR
ncbi:colanic acid biosynthesis glycosyltransferase WcaL [Rhodovulum sp. BSW8]|uniref:glycosyltransferase n=1 Tax=Rhodovulum sp. BSW8 TaxID=2259645 RepID=UPI000DE3B8BD|nr:glycosyltransferase [Rhodovulum sp. BSW8]RBO53186.1 colanic acid biosynthesis glycosyltransferase WcaL [Rhodovulum sp. BSW8]